MRQIFRHFFWSGCFLRCLFLNDLFRRDEGIMLKDPESVYKPNARAGGGWLKIKPEYRYGRSLIEKFLSVHFCAVVGKVRKNMFCEWMAIFLLTVGLTEGGSTKELWKLMSTMIFMNQDFTKTAAGGVFFQKANFGFFEKEKVFSEKANFGPNSAKICLFTESSK